MNEPVWRGFARLAEEAGHRRPTPRLGKYAGPPAGPNSRNVGAEHDIRVEQSQQRTEVTAAGSSKEGSDNFSLTCAIDVGGRARARALHASACTARQLPGRRWRPAHDRRDRLKR